MVLKIVDQLKCIFQPRLLDNNLAQVHACAMGYHGLFKTDSTQNIFASQRPHHHNRCSIVLFVLNIILIERTGKDMYH